MSARKPFAVFEAGSLVADHTSIWAAQRTAFNLPNRAARVLEIREWNKATKSWEACLGNELVHGYVKPVGACVCAGDAQALCPVHTPIEWELAHEA